MPRRRALRVIGTALAVGAFPALRPDRAVGRRSQAKQCSISWTGPRGEHLTNVGGYYYPETEKCCTGPGTVDGRRGFFAWVCRKNDVCGQFGAVHCIPTCPPGETKCGKACCKGRRPTLPAEVCYQGRCRPTCPEKTVKCGNTCCTSKQLCKNGKCCDKCGGNGTCCDPATTYCCREPGDPKSPGRCCKKDKETCCGVGPPGEQKRMCCPKPNKCTRQLPSTKGGLTSTSPWVCCPPERQVPVDEAHPSEINACCAPGQVSLGGKLVVGPGIQGACCDEDKICGSGADLTCCPTGQSCTGGTCA
jgi:hypothetical protein